MVGCPTPAHVKAGVWDSLERRFESLHYLKVICIDISCHCDLFVIRVEIFISKLFILCTDYDVNIYLIWLLHWCARDVNHGFEASWNWKLCKWWMVLYLICIRQSLTEWYSYWPYQIKKVIYKYMSFLFLYYE